MKNKVFSISLYSIIACVATFLIGYFIGKGYTDTVEVEKEVVKYKTEYLPPIHDTIIQPVPYMVYNTDTVERIIEKMLEVDTTEILADYYRVRNYDLDFSNDLSGVFKVNLDITKNSLATARSEVRPIRTTIEKVEMISKVKTLQFYTMLGTSVDFKTNKVQLGVDFRQRYLFGASALRIDDKFSYTIDLGVKF